MGTALASRYDDADDSLHLVGEVEDAAQLADLLEQHHPGAGRTLRVVLSEVTFLPSAAIGVLARAIRDGSETERPVVLACDPAGLPWRVLQITGVPCEPLGSD